MFKLYKSDQLLQYFVPIKKYQIVQEFIHQSTLLFYVFFFFPGVNYLARVIVCTDYKKNNGIEIIK